MLLNKETKLYIKLNIHTFFLQFFSYHYPLSSLTLSLTGKSLLFACWHWSLSTALTLTCIGGFCTVWCCQVLTHLLKSEGPICLVYMSISLNQIECKIHFFCPVSSFFRIIWKLNLLFFNCYERKGNPSCWVELILLE